jgi:hypothetical protein
MSLCLSVYPFVCLCPSFTKKKLRKDTAFLAKQKSVEIRERFVNLSCFKNVSVCLSLSLKEGASKGHRRFPVQTEVCGDLQGA